MTADEDSTPDLQVLLDGIDAEVAEPVGAAGGRPVQVVDLTRQETPLPV